MSSSDLSDVESELTDLEETAPTPGRAPSAEQDSGIHFHAAGPDTEQAQASSSKSKAPQRASGRRKSLRGAAASNDVAADTQPQQPQEAMSPQADASTSASTSRRRIKITSRPQSRAASPAAEAQQQSAEVASKAPKKGIKLNIGRSKAQQQQQQQQDVDQAAPDVPPSAPQAGSSSFRDTLKDLGDSEEDEEEEVIAPAKRGTRRPRGSNAASPGDDAAEQAGDTSQQKVKKRKPEGAKQRSGSAVKKARRNKGDSDEDAQLESDSDEEMQDAASSDDYDEGEGGASKRKGGKASAGKSKAAAAKAAKPQDGAKGKGSAATSKSSKGATGKKQQGSEGDPKSTVGKIRASAAVTAAAASAASSSSSPSQTVDSPLPGPGNNSLSSPIPPIPRKAPQPPGATAPPRRPMPMPMKPRGSDMWDSLVGSSKPRPSPAPARPPPGAQQPKKDGTDQQKNNGPRPPRPPPSAPPGLPRPLGTTGTPLGPSGSSSIARPRSSYPGSMSTSRDAYSSTSNGSFVVHMTPGLNGQHWDKAAYRQLRQSECYAYSNPDPGSLFNLLEDAELVHQFEDEWREVRQGGGRVWRDEVKKDQGGTDQLPVEPLFESCQYARYGAGRGYAETLKGQGKVEVSCRAARLVGRKGESSGAAGQAGVSGEKRA